MVTAPTPTPSSWGPHARLPVSSRPLDSIVGLQSCCCCWYFPRAIFSSRARAAFDHFTPDWAGRWRFAVPTYPSRLLRRSSRYGWDQTEPITVQLRAIHRRTRASISCVRFGPESISCFSPAEHRNYEEFSRRCCRTVDAVMFHHHAAAAAAAERTRSNHLSSYRVSQVSIVVILRQFVFVNSNGTNWMSEEYASVYVEMF